MDSNKLRERLVELLVDSEMFNNADGKADTMCLADHLIENGVIILDKNEHVCRWFNGAQHEREYPCVTCNVNGVVYWFPLPELPKEEI